LLLLLVLLLLLLLVLLLTLVSFRLYTCRDRRWGGAFMPAGNRLPSAAAAAAAATATSSPIGPVLTPRLVCLLLSPHLSPPPLLLRPLLLFATLLLLLSPSITSPTLFVEYSPPVLLLTSPLWL
jgi:hypothetical protein